MKLTRLLVLVACGALLFIAGCSRPVPASFTVDRSNPESVLRAYFDAWQRADWNARASYMQARYSGQSGEPIRSLKLLKVQPAGVSKNAAEYRVEFQIQVSGEGLSMQSGTYDWTYFLTWDEARKSWLISNYGAG